jgi:gluconokinase
MIILLMGVSGTGKTTVGQRLATALRWTFRDADDFHSPANRAKMAAGVPLDDADRAPWLAALRQWIDAELAAGRDAVLACSALKASYRNQLVADPERVKVVFLTGDPALLEARLQGRQGHYMKAGMLASQLATLEPPRAALTIDVSPAPPEIVRQIRAGLGC